MFMNSIPSYISRFLVFILIMTATSIQSREVWTKIATSMDDQSVFYVDDRSIVRSGDVVSVLELVNSKSNSRPVSLRVSRQYDCKFKRLKTLSGELYEGYFASGRPISHLESSPTQWKLIPEGTTADYVLKTLCRTE